MIEGYLPGLVRVDPVGVAPAEVVALALRSERLEAALDAERAAHAQTRTALEASTEDLVFAALKAREDKRPKFAAALDARVQENQRVLGLAVAEADKPHDGNER